MDTIPLWARFVTAGFAVHKRDLEFLDTGHAPNTPEPE